MRRDRHRQQVYDAEGFALGGTIFDELEPWPRLVALAGEVAGHQWWSGLGAPRPTLVPARSDSYRSSSDGSTIRLAPAGHTVITLCHELAHHLVFHLGLDDAGHGPWFRSAELRVVELVCGTQARSFLDEAWRHGALPTAAWPFPEPPAGTGLALSRTATS